MECLSFFCDLERSIQEATQPDSTKGGISLEMPPFVISATNLRRLLRSVVPPLGPNVLRIDAAAALDGAVVGEPGVGKAEALGDAWEGNEVHVCGEVFLNIIFQEVD